MAQHFLLSAKARTLSLKAIMGMSDDEAHARFVQIRFADNGGAAFCPRCECTAVYTYAARRIWKCQRCNHQFSVTSGTIFASRKLPIRDYLVAIALFVNSVKGMSALQLGRDLDVQYKTAFVMAHKIREALGSVQDKAKLSGVVEIDGMYAGRRHNPARGVAVIARERGGKTVATVVASEADAVPFIRSKVTPGSTIHADEMAGWDKLHAYFEMRRVNHQITFKGDDGACTNQAESFFSRLRRAEWGQHHHISGKYLLAYTREMAWREDSRRMPNGTLHTMATGAALGHPVSRTWAGYWQRAQA